MPELFPRYNIAPTQLSAVLRTEENSAASLRWELAQLRWGLVPSWAKELKIGARMINARCETVAEKPAFRSAFKKRRCLVLADGYFEWVTVKREKRPQYIRMQDDQPFAMAGLWERWRGPPGEKLDAPIDSFTVITTDSNELTSDIHDRMPVILREEDWPLWLDPEMQDRQALQPMLKPYPSDGMRVDPVSKYVNNVRHDDADCIAIQKELF